MSHLLVNKCVHFFIYQVSIATVQPVETPLILVLITQERGWPKFSCCGGGTNMIRCNVFQSSVKKNIRKFRRSFRAISNVWKFQKDGFGSLPLYKLFKNASHWADHNSTISSSSHQVLSRVKSPINEIQRCYLTSSNVAVVTAMCDIIPIFMILR